MHMWRWVILTGGCLLIFSSWLALKWHLEYVNQESLSHKLSGQSHTICCWSSTVLSTSALRTHHLRSMWPVKAFQRCSRKKTLFHSIQHLSPLIIWGEKHFKRIISELQQGFLAMLLTMIGRDINQRAFTNEQDTWKRTHCTYFPLKATSHLEYCPALFLSCFLCPFIHSPSLPG